MKFKMERKCCLASSSPRRIELLSILGIPFTVEKSTVVEKNTIGEEFPTVRELVKHLSRQKAEDVASRHEDTVVIGADTLVAIDNKIFPKPIDEQEAKEFLHLLSNNTHQVLTGVTIIDGDKHHSIVSITNVTFKRLSQELIDAYVASGDPLDKAGGYGIQTMGGLFVDSIVGDYNSVVGLPLSDLTEFMLQAELITIDSGENV